ncbi:MAG TPA: M90 family metallopeptidase [Acidimicrobiia bacterium]
MRRPRAPLTPVWHRARGLPAGWADIVERNVLMWPTLDDGEHARLEDAADWLLRHKHWEAAHGFDLTDEMRVTIAIQAALLVLGLGVDEYREVSAVVVHPTTMLSHGPAPGPVPGTLTDEAVWLLGQAHDARGPVLLAWDRVRDSARRPGRGDNVVFHEFAHKLDMVNHVLDGTPLLHSRRDVARWVAVCTEVYDALRAGADRPPLRDYAATNTAEFFAVATEAFFDASIELERNEPDLYDVLRGYYEQDPAARARRAGMA